MLVIPEAHNLIAAEDSLWTSQALPHGLGRREAGACPVPNQFLLELRDAGEDAEDESAVRGRGVHALMQDDELGLQQPKLLQGIDALPQRTGEAVIAVDHHRIHPSPSAIRKQGVERGTLFVFPAQISRDSGVEGCALASNFELDPFQPTTLLLPSKSQERFQRHIAEVQDANEELATVKG